MVESGVASVDTSVAVDGVLVDSRGSSFVERGADEDVPA